jgi:hypothetical protein
MIKIHGRLQCENYLSCVIHLQQQRADTQPEAYCFNVYRSMSNHKGLHYVYMDHLEEIHVYLEEILVNGADNSVMPTKGS